MANSALIADADDAVTPGPGQSVGPGATLGATYRDETNINRLKSVLFLNGVQVGATLTQLPITAATPSSNTYQYDAMLVYAAGVHAQRLELRLPCTSGTRT